MPARNACKVSLQTRLGHGPLAKESTISLRKNVVIQDRRDVYVKGMRKEMVHQRCPHIIVGLYGRDVGMQTFCLSYLTFAGDYCSQEYE